MWLGISLIVMIVVAILGGMIAGGIWTIVLIPLAVIVFLPALLAVLRRREPGAGPRGSGRTRAERRLRDAPLPHARPASDPGQHEPASPDDILRARQGS